MTIHIKNCNFKTWSANHSPDHQDKIYRELYPYGVFERIDFSEKQINKEQVIKFSRIKYKVNLKNIELQENDRYKTTFILTTYPDSKTQGWKKRNWNEKFQIVYSRNFDFITVFSHREDSSKDLLKRFFKGNFSKISENKSLPLSDLLFRSLVLNLSEDLFGQGDENFEFAIPKTDLTENEEHSQFRNKKKKYAPLYSKERKLWVCHAFNEEKANRIGFYIGNQAKKVIVVYCNPTYTRHHRCKYENVEIVSVFEFAYKNSRRIYGEYANQIRLLQNHLNIPKVTPEHQLLDEISNPQNDGYEITKSQLMEAMGIMKIVPKNANDLFLYLSGMNLLNAWINRINKKNADKPKLFRDMYYFKAYLSKTIDELIDNNLGSRLYLKQSLVMIELNDFQFSFHHVPRSNKMKMFLKDERNREIEWSGKRLQPIAPLVFQYAQLICENHKDQENL